MSAKFFLKPKIGSYLEKNRVYISLSHFRIITRSITHMNFTYVVSKILSNCVKCSSTGTVSLVFLQQIIQVLQIQPDGSLNQLSQSCLTDKQLAWLFLKFKKAYQCLTAKWKNNDTFFFQQTFSLIMVGKARVWLLFMSTML